MSCTRALGSRRGSARSSAGAGPASRWAQQDGVQQPYEDLLPYDQFSLRISKPRLRQLSDLLRSIPPDHYARLRAGLGLYWRAFVWDPAKGGRAYNMTIAALQRRATSAVGMQF